MKVAMLGLGLIAEVVVKTLAQMEEVELYAAAARDLSRAQDFAARHGFVKAYGSYEEMLSDPQVELVYIATPHNLHFQHMKLCIEHGKPALCEKPFTLNAREAQEITDLAREKGVYVAEAMWTRYMPSRRLIDEVLASGVLGNVHTMTANLCYAITDKPRIMDINLAGGALLDVGVYGVNFARMHWGDDWARMESAVQFTEGGVDESESVTYFYEDGRMANLVHSIRTRSDRLGIFHGDKGYMIVGNINNPQYIHVYDGNDRLIQDIPIPKQIAGYEYEFLEAIRCIGEGRVESYSMPHAESVALMASMDAIRRQWGLVYPQERA